jgi:hypothetical protein
VKVRVNHPGNDGASSQVNDARATPRELPDFAVAADGRDLSVANRKRLPDAVLGILRHDFAAQEDGIRPLGEGEDRKQQQQ